MQQNGNERPHECVETEAGGPGAPATRPLNLAKDGRQQASWPNWAELEAAPDTTHMAMLERAGIEVPAPEGMNDEQLSSKLWEIIGGLGRLNVYLESTNHLSDRELYEDLYYYALRDEVKDVAYTPGVTWLIDIISSGSEADTEIYFRYYAEDKWRDSWMEEQPDYVMPAHEDPPYDRDRHLPQMPPSEPEGPGGN